MLPTFKTKIDSANQIKRNKLKENVIQTEFAFLERMNHANQRPNEKKVRKEAFVNYIRQKIESIPSQQIKNIYSKYLIKKESDSQRDQKKVELS